MSIDQSNRGRSSYHKGQRDLGRNAKSYEKRDGSRYMGKYPYVPKYDYAGDEENFTFEVNLNKIDTVKLLSFTYLVKSYLPVYILFS